MAWDLPCLFPRIVEDGVEICRNLDGSQSYGLPNFYELENSANAWKAGAVLPRILEAVCPRWLEYHSEIRRRSTEDDS
jgi:hypothetical protein